MSDKKEYQKISKEEFMQDFNIDELLAMQEPPDEELEEDIDDTDLGGTSSTPDLIISFGNAVQNPPPPRKKSAIYDAYLAERNSAPFKKVQENRKIRIAAYETPILSIINNQFAYMPVEQNISTSYVFQQFRSIKNNPQIDPAMRKNVEELIGEYLGIIDSRFSLFASTLLLPKSSNHYYAENLYALDLKYLGLGYSREKFSVMSPFEVMELFHERNIKKHHLAELFDDLEFCRLPSFKNAEVQL
ncbi:hypothetical protein ABEH28_13275 [Pseudomonas sp. Ps21-P2]|uniref:hypothetical protein n=1 Tax=Pseudomonas sp. Ps21-P2 TaxID=3080331 RepID=UPI003208822B